MGRVGVRKSDLRVLVVEDSPADCVFYSRLLNKSFVRPLKIGNTDGFNSALSYTKESSCDLVLLDLSTTDEEPVEAIKTFRNECGLDLPLIILSGNNDPELRVSTVLAGADDYLVKGVDDEKLFSQIVHHTVNRYEAVH